MEPSSLTAGGRSYEIFRIGGLDNVERLPYTLRILLENVARSGSEEGVRAVTGWEAKAEPSREISFAPSRILLQDLTGVPALVSGLQGRPARDRHLPPGEPRIPRASRRRPRRRRLPRHARWHRLAHDD